MKQIIFLPGGSTYDSYDAYLQNLKDTEYDPVRDVRKRWRDSLEERLGDGWRVLAPTMPSKYNAKYLEWEIWFKKVVPHIEEGAILIGHSLGGIFIPKFLAENELPVKIAGTILIAPPYDAEGSDFSLADFVLPDDLTNVARQAGKHFIYFSQDDAVVPFENLEKYRQKFPEAVIREYTDRGHFNQEEFPELVEEIKNI